jgi:hypothetical protein
LRAIGALGLRFVGDVWNLDDAAPAGPTLASHLLSRLGYVALPLTLLENWLELNANVQTYVRYISAALPRQACLSERFSDAACGRRRNLLFLESCGLHGSFGFHVCS